MPDEPVNSNSVPNLECDVVMKGGITSGVVYPGALAKLGATYRFRGVGGASAGAIGAGIAAAAEHGRASGGFDRLATIPSQLGDGRLLRLFQPTPKNAPMLRLMIAATSEGHKAVKIVWALLRSFPISSLAGLAPGVAAVWFATTQSGAATWVIFAMGLFVALAGWVAMMAVRTGWVLTRHTAGNGFGICTGLSNGANAGPGFTDWLSTMIDDVAGVDSPLTFGQLWTGTPTATDVEPIDRRVDLRMVTTCLSEAQPFELPWAHGRYFFDAREWSDLFPSDVMQRLIAAERRSADTVENARLRSRDQPLTRLPEPKDLPVIVATRMSLSFPLLISAIPMWTIDRRSDEFVKVWFTDGGLCSNFPVQMFDSALPTRPTFAINLGRFAQDGDEGENEMENVVWAKNNRSGIVPNLSTIPEKGVKALTGFAGIAFNSARNWNDTSQLDLPGYRDRIVKVQQTKLQGGMNLDMDATTIERLSRRGEAAGAAMVDQFNSGQYRKGHRTGWENHRWVRYRALLAALPTWLDSVQRGLDVLDVDATDPPSYDMSKPAETLGAAMMTSLATLETEVRNAPFDAVEDLESEPNPATTIRRTPIL